MKNAQTEKVHAETRRRGEKNGKNAETRIFHRREHQEGDLPLRSRRSARSRSFKKSVSCFSLRASASPRELCPVSGGDGAFKDFPVGKMPATMRGFTLMEIMMVVAIMGLVMAMGMPSIMANMKKEGMRKAITDVEEICKNARERAILSGTKTSITFHPADKKLELDGGGSAYQTTATTLPDGVDIAMLDINVQDYVSSPWAKVFFYPNGTSDEMVLVLHSRDEWKKISLEFTTALTVLSDVDK